MLETEIKLSELVEIIHAFPLSADFLNWLSNEDFNYQILHEEVSQHRYQRIIRYTIENTLIFTGIKEFILDSLNPKIVQAITSQRTPLYFSQFSKASKKPLTTLLTSSHYTAISELSYEKIPCGTAWEIYQMPNILKFYQLKNNTFFHG